MILEPGYYDGGGDRYFKYSNGKIKQLFNSIDYRVDVDLLLMCNFRIMLLKDDWLIVSNPVKITEEEFEKKIKLAKAKLL